MYNFALINDQGICINATSSPNEGVYPAYDSEKGDYLVEISQADFDNGPVGKYWNAEISQLEPFINRCLVLLTQGPYLAGIINLQFEQQDLSGQPVMEPTTFTVTVNGQTQEVVVEDGTLEVELNCPEPAIVTIGITAWRYEPVCMEVVVGG